MAILKIARMGHPVLNRTADPVEDPTAPEIHRLIADMVDTLADAGGVGLAAPQVHMPKRVVIFTISESRARDEAEEEGEEGDDKAEEVEAVPMTVLINRLYWVSAWRSSICERAMAACADRLRSGIVIFNPN